MRQNLRVCDSRPNGPPNSSFQTVHITLAGLPWKSSIAGWEDRRGVWAVFSDALRDRFWLLGSSVHMGTRWLRHLVPCSVIQHPAHPLLILKCAAPLLEEERQITLHPVS